MDDSNKLVLLLVLGFATFYIINQNNNTKTDTKEDTKEDDPKPTGDVDCEWSEYGSWSDCKDGKRSRTRTEKTKQAGKGKVCVGDMTETETCSTSTYHCVENDNKFIIIMKDLYSNYFCLKTKESKDCFDLKTKEGCKKFSNDFQDPEKKNFLTNSAGVSISLYCKNDDYSDTCNQLRS